MNKFFKRLALLLAVLMIVSMMPVQLFADNSVTGEGQSNGTTQNKAVASYELNGETISFEGKTIREVNTKMREFWKVDDAQGCSYNADKLPADGTGELTWTIYGTVGQGEYLNSGALILPALSGGYIYKNGTYQWKNITVVAGDKNATIVSNDTFDVDHIYVSNGANTTTTFTGITLDGSLYVVPNGTVTFDGCVFKGMLRVPNGYGVVKVANCQFVGDADKDSTGKKNEYPFFFQAGGTLEFIGNTIAAHTYKRGLNVGGLTELNATIENNTIGAVTEGYSAIQLSGGVTEAQIKGNEISLDGTNAFTLHESLISANKVTKVTVEGNKITGNGYLIYDDAAANNKAFTSDNLTLAIGTNTVASTVDTKQGVKESNKYGISETVATVVKGALTTVATVNGVGYATLADAIAAANGNGTVTLLTATTELVQALLDGQYGSIDGLTIELPTGGYGKLELGRATKYAGSNTEYFVGGFDSTAENYKAFTSADEIRKYKGQSAWTPNCFYRRALKNVTIKAADGAKVTIEKISADAGQIYGKADAPKYDYVLDVEIPDTNKSYYMALAWNNVKFEGINFKSSVNIESSSEKTLIDGLHFEKCNFNSGYTALAAANDPNKASKGMGIRFVSWTKTTNNLRNLTVSECTFEDCYEGVYTNPVYGVSVTNSSFNNINHNAVAIQDDDKYKPVDHGNVVISDNHFENVGDRIIRFNNVGDGTIITITGNTSVNSGDSAGEIIKATTMPDSVKINMTSNTWGDVNGKTAVLGNGFKPTSATIDASKYETLDDAIKAAKDGDVIVLASGVTVYLTNGVANEGSNARKVTIKGDGTQIVDVITYAVSAEGGMLNYQRGSSFTFDSVTVQAGEGSFDGIVCSALTLNNCTLKGKLTLYGAAIFTGCTFENTMADQYSIWTWGGTDVKFEGCTFNTNGKAILLYGQATEEKPTNLTVNGCKFNDRMNGAAGKAAIEIGNDYNATYTLVADNCEVNGFAAGKNTGSTLWGNKNSMADEKLTVIKDSEVLKGGAAKVGNKNYATLAEAIAALNSTNHTLTLIDASAWDAATPVYWQAGTQSGYAAKLTDALTAAYKANAGDITIVCRPGADVGAMTHGHVADNLTVYGNNAYISGGECDLEVDTYMYSRETGKQVATGGVYLDKAITITAYELDNLGVWGHQRHTGYTINISLNDCDGKAIEGKANVQRVYISGTTGVNNITVVGCDFLTKATALYSNADGETIIDNCSFAGSQVPVNFNHKANGTQTVTVKNSKFTNCGDKDEWKQFAAPVRFVNSGSGTSTATVDNCTFTGTVGANGDILLGDGRNGEASFNVSVTVVDTAANVQIHQPGYYGADGSTTVANCEKTTVAKSNTPTTFFTVAVAEVTFTDGTTKKYSDIAEAIAAANAGDTVTLLADINTPEKTYEITKSLTIDLNGKTVTGSGYDGVFEVTGKNINVVLNATNGGKVIAVENSGSSGKYAMAVWMCGAGSTLTINGGKFIQNITSTNDKQMDMIYASAGTIIINSGSFTSGTPKWTLNIKDSAYKAGTANIIVNGGTFTDYDPRNAENEGKGTSLVADGVGIDKNADGTFTAKSGMAAQIVDADGNSVAAYATLADAIAAAKSGATVTLLDNIDISTTGLTISAERTITLDLNGHTLKVANTDAGNIKVCGKLTLKDSTDTAKNGTGTGKIYTETPYIYGTQDKVMIATMSGGEFTMESGLIDAASFTTDNANVGHFAVSVQNDNGNATVTINGGHIKAGWYAIAGNGQNSSFEGNIIVNGGILESVADYAIYHPHAGTTTINGGVVFGAAGGVSINRGKLVVNGGTITSKGTGTTGNWGDGTGNQAAAAINVNAKYETTTVEIKGGTITAEKDAILLTNGRDGSIAISGGTFSSAVPEEYCADGFIPTQNEDGTYGVKEATKGSKKNPYTLEELGAMTRAEYIAAQEALGGTMYVEIGDYSYGTNGVLGNGVRNDTPGQTPDHSKLNSYGENGYIGANNDGANGKKIIFVGGSITSRVKGYASIDNIGTSLLLAVPAYTNVTFEGVTFNNVMSFDYQLYTSPWSQLGELKFSGCTFNGIIVGAIAAQTLTFNKCIFTDYTNKDSANNSNPTWIRPAYGNWSKGDNEGQGSDFRSLTTINFTNNTVTSTRPVKFERIAQWEMDTKVSVKNNEVTISAQKGDTSTKSVGFYFGANAKFDLTLDGNKKLGATSALYTAVYKAPNGTDYAGLPAGSTVKDSKGADVEVAGVIWKSTDALTLKTTTEAVKVGGVKFATLEEAVAAVAKNGEEVTIKLLSNITAGGIDVAAGQNIVFDFDGHTYTLDGSMVGSTGTKTNGFRFLKGSTVVLKNGTLANGNGSPAKAMINSYATLKLVDFSVDARTTAVAETGSAYGYAALYISNGVTTVTGNGNYTTSDDNFVILIANVGDYTDGASLVFDENYTGTVSGRVSTGNKQNATVEIKNGKFDLKSIDVENTNTTVTISGGKFKNIEIAGKYLDNKAFDTEADADGYYAVMAHPITGIGLSIGEDISLRVIVRNGYQDGKLFYSYIDANGNLVEEKATIGKDTKGNYVFRIYNINPQRAGTIYTLRYEDKAGNTVGALKEASILTYLEGLYDKKIENETATKEAARKVYIANFLEYCAAAATRAYPDDESRTQAIRDLMNKLGLEVTHFTLDEDHAGETYNDNAEKVFTGLGIEYGSIMRIYYAVSEEAYNAGYVYKQAGHVISNPIEIVEGKNGKEYRLYLNIPPYEYFSGQTITVEDSEENTICVYSCPMGRILLRFSNTERYEEKVTSVARAAFDYCAALKAYLRSK